MNTDPLYPRTSKTLMNNTPRMLIGSLLAQQSPFTRPSSGAYGPALITNVLVESLTRNALNETLWDFMKDFSTEIFKALGPLKKPPDSLEMPKIDTSSSSTLTGVNLLFRSNARALAHVLLPGHVHTLGAHAVRESLSLS